MLGDCSASEVPDRTAGAQSMPPLTEMMNCDARSSLRRAQSPMTSRFAVPLGGLP